MGGKPKKPTFEIPPWQQDLINRAQSGIGQQTQELSELQGILKPIAGGADLYGGSGFNAALEAAKNKIIPDIESRFARGGRLSSGLARISEASGIGDAFAGLYEKEQQRQMDAIKTLSELSGKPLRDLAGILGTIKTPEPTHKGSKTSRILGGALGGATLGGKAFGLPGALLGGAVGGIGSLF